MRIGLCLSGGGIKGAAHIGVLKALEEKHVKIDCISGSSSGSIVAALYAIGYTPDEIYSIFKEYASKIKYVDAKNIIKLVSGLIIKEKITISGLTAGNKLERLVQKKCIEKGVRYMKDVKMPLYISAVCLESGDTYIFTNTNCKYDYKLKLVNNIEVWKAVRASCSYPGVFEPLKWNGTELVDGGVRENIPWKVLKNCGADKVLSVIFKNEGKKNCSKNVINVIDCSLGYLNRELAEYEIFGSDEIVEIKTNDIGLLDYTKVDELYKIGYEAGKNIGALPNRAHI